MVVGLLKAIAYLISNTLCFVRFSGRENIPDASSGGLLIAGNHQTYVDPVWISIAVKRRLRYMAYDRAFGWRFIGTLITYLGAFPVAINGARARRSMRNALGALHEGSALIVFPEGAREFADGEMLPFKTGAVRIALQAGVPILPVTIRGGNHIWPQKQKYPRLFRRVEVIYHPLLNVAADETLELRENLDNWTSRLREIIATGLNITQTTATGKER